MTLYSRNDHDISHSYPEVAALTLKGPLVVAPGRGRNLVVCTVQQGMLSNVHLVHLGLPVRDAQRSRIFYEQFFGFDPDSAQRYDDSTLIIRNGDGFDLALHPGGRVGPSPEFLHFGFRFDDPDQVRELLAGLRADDVPIIEEHEEPTYVAFKCLDPDGHRVEGYWEPPRSA
jgi:catechol 2,3-dioxygenase-like lactoylglutathione lyase family enzyme